MTRVVAIVQARMGSTRLPGKVLMNILDKPMLLHEVERISRANTPDLTVVATTKNRQDEAIVQMCKENDIPWFVGNEIDVLDRYYQCAHHSDADVIIRLTGDCPLIDPDIIDSVVGKFFEEYPYTDYASNVYPVRTFPRGLDVEVIGLAALERAWWCDSSISTREHVTQHIIRNSSEFAIENLINEQDHSDMRWTVDTIEDFRFVQSVYEAFGVNMFSWVDVLQLLKEKPELQDINRHIQQKEVTA